MNWHEESVETVKTSLDTDINNGLTTHQAQKRLEKYGRNILKEKKEKSFAELFFEHFKGPLSSIIFGAAVVSVIIAVNAPEIGNWQESIVVVLLLIARAFVYAFCDRKSLEAEKKLDELMVCQIKTLRDGKELWLAVDELTVGDIILLSAGDVVPADCRLIECSQMTCDERVISCDAISSEKCGQITLDVTAPVNERVNMIYCGCPVLSGQGKAVVTAVGKMTVLGKTAPPAGRDDISDESFVPRQKQFDRLFRVLSISTALVCALVILVGFINRYNHDLKAIEIFMTTAVLSLMAVSKDVKSLIFAVITQGRSRAAKRGAYISDGGTVENLDKLSVICSDKTGTLTESRMILTQAWTADGKLCRLDNGYLDKAHIELISHAALCSNFRPSDGESDDRGIRRSTERAIVLSLLEHNIKKTHLEMKYPRVAELAFDRGTRLMTTVHRFGERYIVITKGAPDALLPLCRGADTDKADAVCSSMGSSGLRVVAVGYRIVDSISSQELSNNDILAKRLECELTLEGFLGIANPPRTDARGAIDLCRSAGIRVVMMTAEDEAAAKTISQELGIMSDGDEIITGEELAKLSDDELIRRVRKVSAYARISHQDKQRIVKAWKDSDECVGITGDVVGDTETLKDANVGFAMGRSGVNAAMLAADVTVIDDSFMTITDAVREGREISDRVRNALRLIFTYGIGVLLLMLVCLIGSGTVPLLSVHLLALALITGIVPVLSFVYTKTETNVMKRRPHRLSDTFFSKKVGVFVLLQGIMLAAISSIAFFVGLKYSIDIARTMAFASLALSQISLLLELRMLDLLRRFELKENKLLLVVIVAVIVLIILSVMLLWNALLFEPLAWRQWRLVLVLSIMPIVSAELFKIISKWLGKYINIREDE